MKNENRHISIHARDAYLPVRRRANSVAIMASYGGKRQLEKWVYDEAESYIAESFFGKPFEALSEDQKDAMGGLVGEFVRTFFFRTAQLKNR